MSYLARIVPATFVLALPLAAQLPQDTWVASTFDNFISGTGGGGLHLVSADRTTYTFPTGQTANMAGANAVVADGTGFLYYGTFRSSRVPVPNPGEIFQVIVSGGAVVSEVRLTSQPPDTGSISGLTLRGDQIWYVTDGGNVGWIPRPTPANPPPYAPTNVMNFGAQGVIGLGQSITTDGREVFFGVSYSPSNPSTTTIWGIDAEDPTPTLRAVSFPFAGSVFDMSMGQDGNIMAGVIGGRLFSVDPETGSFSQLNSGAPAPQGNSNGAHLNPWDDIIGVVPGFGSTPRQLDHFDVATATWFANPVGILGSGVPSNVTSATDQPFERFGRGCTGINGMEPRTRWRGVGAGGQSIDLTLSGADPSTVAFLVFGFSDQFSQAFGQLPFDLTNLGAPGCFLYVSADISLLLPVDMNGNASLTIQVPSGLGSTQLFAQWGVVSGANTLGIVPTGALRIRTR